MFREGFSGIVALGLVFGHVLWYGPSPAFGQFRSPFKGKKTSVDFLAENIDKLEYKVGLYGSVVAKAPDVWGQARLTRHRDEFEQQMAEQLDKFNFTFNGELARTDQAYLQQALSLSAVINAASTPVKGGSSPTVVTTAQAAAPAAPAPSSPADGGAAPPAPAASTFLDNTVTLARKDPTGLLQTKFAGTGADGTPFLAVEPEILLDQRARYLNHLHELRRINEGDDTADSPGYSLNLVRVPISVLPGDRTREGYGAEITITATSHLTEELLPQTFRALVINDLVDQLALPIAQYLDSTWDANLKIEQVALEKNVPIELLKAEGQKRVKDRNQLRLTIQPNLLDAKVRQQGELRWNIMGLDAAEKKSLKDAVDTTEPQAKEKHDAPMAAPVAVGSGLSSPRSRRSRYAIPSSQISDVFGKLELITVADAAFKVRDRYQCENRPNRMGLIEVQAFLRAELDAAYDFLYHHPYRTYGTPGPDNRGLWWWVERGNQANQLVNAIRSVKGVQDFRTKFFNAAHNPGALNTLAKSKHVKARRPSVQTAGYQDEPNPIGPAPVAIEALAAPGGDAPAETNPPEQNAGSTANNEDSAQNITEALAWAIVVESVLLNERLNEDIQRVSQDPGCGCQPTDGKTVFYLPEPDPPARQAFMDYVRCRWPIHVFALDPVTQQQNIADTYALRRETQVALAVAFTGGSVSGNSLTRYMRRIEEDMRTIELNNTIVGFGHGADTFGWRFYPRFQIPQIESNMTVFGRDLIWGGPNQNARMRKQRLESGTRECVAIVVMPSFVRHVTFETRSNWFQLANCRGRADTGASLTDTLEWSRAIKCMEDSVQCCVGEAELYRHGEVERLLTRVKQLSHRLPLQTLNSQVPYENTLGGFEMFSSGVTDLAPELIGYYGAPGIDPNKSTELFLVGNHFSVHDTQVLAGNVRCKINLLSRQVMRVTVPPGVRPEWRRDNPDDSPPPADPVAAALPDPACGTADRPGCCQKYVEIRLATPYGIASQLHVPVIVPPKCAPILTWSPADFPLTYYWTGASPWAVADTDIQAKPPFTFAIKVPDNVVVSKSAVTLEFALIGDGDSTGVAIVTSLPAIPFNRRDGQYTIDGANFVTLQTTIRTAVVNNLLKANPKAPPSDYIARLQATVIVDDVRIVVDNQLYLPIHFNQK